MATTNAERQAKYRAAKRQTELDLQTLQSAVKTSLSVSARAVEIIRLVESGEKNPTMLRTALELLAVVDRELRGELSHIAKHADFEAQA